MRPAEGILFVDTEVFVRTRVQKWGNSLAVRIPRPFAEEAGLKPSTEVVMALRGDTLEVTAVRPRWTLERLLEGITRSNRHAEEDFGRPTGNEAW